MNNTTVKERLNLIDGAEGSIITSIEAHESEWKELKDNYLDYHKFPKSEAMVQFSLQEMSIELGHKNTEEVLEYWSKEPDEAFSKLKRTVENADLQKFEEYFDAKNNLSVQKYLNAKENKNGVQR